MKIVIDIPEDYYKAIKEIPVEKSTGDMMIIQNGTLLDQELCNDVISRQYLIEKATSWKTHFTDSERYVSLTDIQNAPPVKPTEKVGQWEWNQYDSNPKIGNFHCSQCYGIGKSYYDYCPYCKAKMLASPTGAESEG